MALGAGIPRAPVASSAERRHRGAEHGGEVTPNWNGPLTATPPPVAAGAHERKSQDSAKE